MAKEEMCERAYYKKIGKILCAREIQNLIKKLGGEAYERNPAKALIRVVDVINAINEKILK